MKAEITPRPLGSGTLDWLPLLGDADIVIIWKTDNPVEPPPWDAFRRWHEIRPDMPRSWFKCDKRLSGPKFLFVFVERQAVRLCREGSLRLFLAGLLPWL